MVIQMSVPQLQLSSLDLSFDNLLPNLLEQRSVKISILEF